MVEQKMNIPQRHAFLEAHRVEMLADRQAMSCKAFRIKWDLAPSTWHNLAKRWGVDSSGAILLDTVPVSSNRPQAAAVSSKQPQAAAISPNGQHPPALPPWRDDWPEAVQLRWLQVLDKMTGGVAHG